MKKVMLFIAVMWMACAANAAFVTRMPVVRLQPNGDTLHCFVTGDEFYHRLHDDAGYTIVQNPTSGWYVYADRQWNEDHSDWQLVATDLIAGQSNPAAAGISPNLIASPATVDHKHKQWEIPERYRVAKSPQSKTMENHGKLNNVVIFIRFADDSEITTPMSTIESMFNDSSANAISMHNYFWRASYGQLRIPTYFYPTTNSDQIISYQDSLPRSRFLPYNATTNPTGYQNDSERAALEFGLLERAVNYVNQNSPVPSDLNIDYDNDGMVDNICFILKGTYTGWNDLLWPHKWALYDRHVYLNGKRVYTFNLQLEGSGSHYFSTSTFCHEMFHTLGAPDLYHYNNYTNVTAVGIWDLMCNNTTPPQHMGMYMKMRYGRWLDTVPEITEAGTYSLRSVGDSIPRNNCYRIQAGSPDQWYYLEYRDNNELFEEGLPGSGLLVYRINSRFEGNSNFDGIYNFDEVYIFHPNGTDDTTGGTMAQAFFSEGSGRTAFTPTTNPHPWLSGGIVDTTLYITNIGAAGDSITFTYTPHRPQTPACDSTCSLTVTMRDPSQNTWQGAYLIFEKNDGTVYTALSMGDCRAQETRVVNTCSGEPVVVRWGGNGGAADLVTIRLGDGNIWQPTSGNYDEIMGTIMDPCGLDLTQYTLTVQSNDNVNSVNGGGVFTVGTTTRIRAYPQPHYTFKGWHDGPYSGPEDNDIIHNTQQNRNVTVVSDSLITAIFEAEQYTIFASSNDESMGNVDGGGLFNYGDTATLTATANSGYDFDYWKYGSFTMTENPLHVAVQGNAGYVAYFKPMNGIPENGSDIRIGSNGLTIAIEGATMHQVEIFDLLGHRIYQSQGSGTHQFTVPQSGVYLIRIDGIHNRKIVVR